MGLDQAIEVADVLVVLVMHRQFGDGGREKLGEGFDGLGRNCFRL